MAKLQHLSLTAMTPEIVNPKMARKMLWGDRIMMAFMEFKKGFVVPTHHHDNEQLTYCISGTMRFTFPDRTLDLRGGEVLVIPSNLPHSAEMVDDVVEADFFSPPRQEWIAGTDTYLRR
jgi:unsaturated pyranuronate lyase